MKIIFLVFIFFVPCLVQAENSTRWACGPIQTSRPLSQDVFESDGSTRAKDCWTWWRDKKAADLPIFLDGQPINGPHAFLKHLRTTIPVNFPPFIEINIKTKKVVFNLDKLLVWFNDAPAYEGRANLMMSEGQSLSAKSVIKQVNGSSGNYFYAIINYTNETTGQKWIEAHFAFYRPGKLLLSYSSQLFPFGSVEDNKWLERTDEIFSTLQFKRY